MELTFEQIISATNGIIRTEKNELGLELHRFTRDQEAFFYKTHPLFCKESFFNGYFARNCRCGAGITLDFISDAKVLTIKFGQTEYAKSKYERTHLLDLYIDGEFVESYKAGNDITYNALGERQRFTLYFPCMALPIISSMQLENATTFIPLKKNIDILFLGDSITQGAFAVHPSNCYVMRVARKMNVGVLNQGNSGFVYDVGTLEKVCEPKIIVTAYGINDFNRKNVQLIEKETAEYFTKLKELYKNAKIVSILPIWTRLNFANENFKINERACLKNIYEQYSDYVLDGHQLFPKDNKYLADDYHPNDEGFAFYGENLAKELEGILSKEHVL